MPARFTEKIGLDRFRRVSGFRAYSKKHILSFSLRENPKIYAFGQTRFTKRTVPSRLSLEAIISLMIRGTAYSSLLGNRKPRTPLN